MAIACEGWYGLGTDREKQIQTLPTAVKQTCGAQTVEEKVVITYVVPTRRGDMSRCQINDYCLSIMFGNSLTSRDT